MTDKRRGGTKLTAVFIIGLTVILLLWRHSGCPGPPESEPISYLLIQPTNSSQPPPYRLDLLPPSDTKRLIDLENFEFVINSRSVCNESDPLLVALVHTAPPNVNKRAAIRKTWGSHLKVLFLVGMPTSDELQQKLMDENEIHQDFIQGNFIDAYRNMTYKHVMALKWTTYFCRGARYILKTDDDVFVNPWALRHYLSVSLSPYGARRLIMCHVLPYAHVQRSYRSKWRVAFSEYGGDHYPAYCSGYVVLYSPDAVFALYRHSQAAKYFWIDDVFITGLMASRANIPRSKLDKLVLTQDRRKNLHRMGPHEDFFLFGPADLKLEDIYSMWEIVKKWGEPSESWQNVR